MNTEAEPFQHILCEKSISIIPKPSNESEHSNKRQNETIDYLSNLISPGTPILYQKYINSLENFLPFSPFRYTEIPQQIETTKPASSSKNSLIMRVTLRTTIKFFRPIHPRDSCESIPG